MTTNEYLNEVLESQELLDTSDEMKDLQKHRADVEKILRNTFYEASPTIRYGGSKAKGTLIRESYDLDVICYFSNGDTSAGETLEDIYNNAYNALSKYYSVTKKNSSLRLKSNNEKSMGLDFHVDVVPGRYTDDTKGDCFIHQELAEESRMKTNLQVHIDTIRDSGVVDAIRLQKLWKVRRELSVKQFAWELLVIKILDGKASQSLEKQLEHIWITLRDANEIIPIEDPANPTGNDLTGLLEDVWDELTSAAGDTLKTIKAAGWSAVFGSLQQATASDRISLLESAAVITTSRTKPWSPDTNGESLA